VLAEPSGEGQAENPQQYLIVEKVWDRQEDEYEDTEEGCPEESGMAAGRDNHESEKRGDAGD
jgi:hypothetical protein